MTATATRGEKTDAKDAKDDKGKAGKDKASPLKSKKFIIVLALLLVAGGAAYKILLGSAPAGPPVGGGIVAMEATTVNLRDGHYLKIAVAVQLVEGKATMEEFKSSEAAELVIDQFSDRTVAAVSSNEARKRLMTQLEQKIKHAYEGEVFTIFLTQFVTQ